MRDWRSYWAGRETGADDDLDTALREVGKTVLGTPISAAQLDAIATSILAALGLDASDRVADLGCGNGLVTARIADRVAHAVGIDMSGTLIAAARRRHGGSGAEFALGDLTRLDFTAPPLVGIGKAYLYEVAQHLDADEFAGLLEAAMLKGGVRRLFSGSMPDAARLEAFYDTPERMALYRRNLASGREQIGHWWGLDELERIAGQLGLALEIRQQAPILHTAHYRFDALFHATR
ncbi:hypothetical protein LNKW23_48290 [Paralimibaculum aggregatum]|uniref:Methyltransferase domain-containing protein n=1 Tax=Paralimibaculum aggregatum TaxID=3036245 RepID=A0ABQ6LU81_9RHOB|nr:class I SAM-dependent methyltransferase [Limibaculum sp. NKW23]GMG85606.1 hypothetical protein LNKW23_48290 [Limibaculum sp. NKW23]